MNFSRAFRSAGLSLLTSLIFTFAVLPVRAQEASSAIAGTVTDPSGGVIPNVRVVAQNTSTNVTYPTKSNGSGYYSLPVVPAGRYILRATAPGFAPTQSSPFVIETGLPVRIDLPPQGGLRKRNGERVIRCNAGEHNDQ